MSTDGAVRVAVVGSYNVGLTMAVPSFPVPGETVIGSGFEESGGGKGSNQAIAAARLGAEAMFVGQVGADKYGEDASALWDREGVDASHVLTDPDTHTGVGFVIVNESGENEITVAPGSNSTLSAADVRKADDDVAACDVLLVQMEIPDEPIQEAITLASEEGLDVVLNPAPARDVSEETLRRVDFLTPNQSEARTLAGYAPDVDVSDEAVARDLLETGVGTVVMTRGGDGALLVTDSGVEYVEAPSVPVVDTTGAGDAFNAAFAVALAEDERVRDAVRFGCEAGALAVTEAEVIPALPRRDEVDRVD